MTRGGPRSGSSRRPRRARPAGTTGARRPAARPVPSGRAVDGGGSPLPAVLQMVASVVAPTTLLTALLFYFGRLHSQNLTRHLRVPFTVFDFTAQDYLVRSADGLFVPLVIVLVVALVLLWAHRGLGRLSPRRRERVVAVLAPVTAALGLVLVALAVLWALGGLDPPGVPELGGLALSAGVVSVAYAVRVRRSGGRDVPVAGGTGSGAELAAWGAAFVLFGIGLFWAVNSYAIGVGTSRGQQIERELGSAPDVALYSEKSLGLRAAGVRETVCGAGLGAGESAYRFRYDGLKLVLQAGGQYLFLPAGWTRASGVAVVIPRSSAIRLEFGAPGSPVPASC